MSLHVLPTTPPTEDILYLVQNVMSPQNADKRQLMASGFAVLEYAAGVVFSPGATALVPRLVGPVTFGHAQKLVAELTCHTIVPSAGGIAVDWQQIVSILSALLQTWLHQ